jgi:SPP1 gp7 family putative phage head morphogenesis protein
MTISEAAKKRAAAMAAKRAQRERFVKARRAEKQYSKSLSSVAREVGKLIRDFAPNGVVSDMGALRTALMRYAQALEPWARAVAYRMLNDVSRRDAQAWNEQGREIGRNIRREIVNTPLGAEFREIMTRQVGLITSLPLEAAERAQRLAALSTVSTGARANEIAKEIKASGAVTMSRARLIARTETSRAVTSLTQARALSIGSEGYIWRTSADPDVRPDHRKLNGKFIRWDSPPVADERTGERAHAGSIYNCRCYAEPVIPDDL